METIPVIDFRPFRQGDGAARREVARAVGAACEHVGFLYLADHGVPQAQVDAVFRAARTFFAAPESVRMDPRIRIGPESSRGYQPVGARFYGDTDAPDLMEAFKYQAELPPDDPDLRAGDRIHEPNRWPAGMDEWRTTLTGYFDAVEGLGRDLLRGFALALDLEEDWFLAHYRKPLTQVSLLHYPPQPPTAPERQYGNRPHADATSFTILAQDEVGGLEVLGRDGTWLQAPPIPGTYVINIGDWMARWTNDRFRSTLHRVVNRSGRERYSVPYFAIPDFDAVVTCIPTCTGPGNPPKYEPVHVGTAIRRKFSSDYKGRPASARSTTA